MIRQFVRVDGKGQAVQVTAKPETSTAWRVLVGVDDFGVISYASARPQYHGARYRWCTPDLVTGECASFVEAVTRLVGVEMAEVRS